MRDLNECLTRWKANSVKILSENMANHQVFLLSPDGLKIEIYEDKTISAPIVNHHIHFYDASIADTKGWYVKTFGAKPGRRAMFEAADVPGVNLSFSLSDNARGRHQGPRARSYRLRSQRSRSLLPEARSLRRQVRRPVSKSSVAGHRHCLLHRPFGTYIELTEGLNKL